MSTVARFCVRQLDCKADWRRRVPHCATPEISKFPHLELLGPLSRNTAPYSRELP